MEGPGSAGGQGKVPVSVDESSAITAFRTPGGTFGTNDAVLVAHTHTFSATTSSDGAHTHGAGVGNYMTTSYRCGRHSWVLW